MNPTSSRLVKVLRSTLNRIERSEELAPDDPALTELKESVLSKIAELEVAKTPKTPVYPKRILWISPKPGAGEEIDPAKEQQPRSDSGELVRPEPDGTGMDAQALPRDLRKIS
jgi:hypothetical protein